MGILRFAIKSSILGGVTYYTIQEGLWSSPDESAKFYGKLYNNIAPYVKTNIPEDIIKDIPTLPNPLDFRNCAVAHYNKYVKISIKFLADLPEHISNGVERIQKELSNPPTTQPAITEKQKSQ